MKTKLTRVDILNMKNLAKTKGRRPQPNTTYQLCEDYLAMLDVLKFYGDEKNWLLESVNDPTTWDAIVTTEAFKDNGAKAREVLG